VKFNKKEYEKEYKRVLRLKRRTIGVCVDCDSTLAPHSKSYCQKCLDKWKRYKAVRLSKNLCRTCGKNTLSLFSNLECDKCLERTRWNKKKYSERIRQKGLCRCGKPLSSKWLCAECLASHRNRFKAMHEKWLSEGRCYSCGGGLIEGEKYKTCISCRMHLQQPMEVFFKRKLKEEKRRKGWNY